MDDRNKQYSRIHNIVLIFITVACIGAVVESITLNWEFWVPPLIILGTVVCWTFHLGQYRQRVFRENFYLFFCMLVAFYHGVHATSLFDLVVISAVLMVTVALLARREFLILLLGEYFLLLLMQLFMIFREHSLEFDPLTISRLLLHVVVELCIYRALNEVIRFRKKDAEEMERRESEKESERSEMEDFLVNISHELRTPVNVINGMSSLILKKEDQPDVIPIRDAGLRLSRQIEDIQDYSEVQRGNVMLETEKYMITSVINDVITEQYEDVKNKGLELVVDLDPTVPAVLFGDPGKISKILRHLLSNAVKFTPSGGIYMRISGIRRDYGINLQLEVTDTGVGMSTAEAERLSDGTYQANKKRNRSTGGIGLGLPIVYGFTRKMGGFVNIEGEKRKGLSVRVSIAQEIVDPSPCLSLDTDEFINIAFHIASGSGRSTKLQEFSRNMTTHLAAGLRVNLYAGGSIQELKRLLERSRISHIFLGAEDYAASREYFDELARGKVTVAVSAPEDFDLTPGSSVILIPGPLYGYPVVRVLNGDRRQLQPIEREEERRPELTGVRALVVDDEPMNLVVAGGLFRDYKMLVDTAGSGKEAIEKFSANDYDLVFMDHMMPGMDGVEAMKRLKEIAGRQKREVCMIALTANAISGAREMFLNEGFDGFIAKPINIPDFERTINKVFLNAAGGKGGRSEV
ncbi:MAG: response regulator [Lachnospiraceae bacterium]|nr:response regulator [Lachnospiraceae bacterium]